MSLRARLIETDLLDILIGGSSHIHPLGNSWGWRKHLRNEDLFIVYTRGLCTSHPGAHIINRKIMWLRVRVRIGGLICCAGISLSDQHDPEEKEVLDQPQP